MAAARISTDRFIWSVKRLLDGFIRPAGGAGWVSIVHPASRREPRCARLAQSADGSNVRDTPLMQYRSLVGVG